jgi:hypothetical protein
VGRCWDKQEGNLGQCAQNARFRMSVLMLSAALGLAVWLVAAAQPAWVRALVFFPLLFAAMGAYQGLYKTCIVAAIRGVRVMDDGEFKLGDPAQRASLAKSGRRALVHSVLTALTGAVIIAAIPC